MLTKSKSCLLVEDDPEDQQFFMEALHSVSNCVGCYAVGNGEEALSALLRDDFWPDYIFTDLHMPRMDGFEFIKIIKGIEKFRSIPIIVYSSDFSDSQLERVKALGATAFYSKTRLSALPEILRRYFTERSSHAAVS